jgi:DNA-binding MarR family transcriptional regulator
MVQQICLSGGRVGVLASRLQLTKQAVGQVLDGLERAGWVRRAPDPDDGRVRLIFYTESGCQLVSDTLDVTRRVERRLMKRIGPQRLKALKEALSHLAAQ